MTNSSIEDLLNKRARTEDRMVYKPTGVYGGETMIHSEECDDPRSMTIYDPKTGFSYTEEAAKSAPAEIRSRLVNHCTRKGYDIMTIDEAEEALRRQRP